MAGVEERWHLSKSVSISHILSTLVIAASVIMYAADIQNEQEKQQLQIEHLKAQRVADLQRTDAQFSELKRDLRDINAKLDRIIERE